MVDLDGYINRRASQMSGGQRQRVALARAIVFKPSLILMDEPLSVLDKQLREVMQMELRELHRKLGATIVYVTHDQRIGSLFFWVNKSYSRGQVRLNARDVHGEPLVDFRMLSDELDLARLKMAFRMGVEALGDTHMNGYRGQVFPASYSPRLAALALPNYGKPVQARRVLGPARYRRTVAAFADSFGSDSRYDCPWIARR